MGNNTVANRLCLSRLRDTGPAEQRSEQADMHLFVKCVFISTSSVSIHMCLFFLLRLPVMSNIHAFLPAATFLQSCFLTQFVLLATLPGLVSLLKNSFPLCNILALFFYLLFFPLVFDCFRLKDTDNTCWQHRTPIFLQFLQPAVVFYRKKPPCPRLHS